MKLTRIYAVHCNRPDFVVLQHRCLSKWFLDPFEFTVINNARTESNRHQISNAAATVGAAELHTHSDADIGKTGKHHADALNQAWRTEITRHNDYAMVLDGDVFLLDNFHITDLLSDDKPIFGLPQHRDIFNYIGPMVVGFDLARTMLAEELDWEGLEIVPHVHLDTGGGTHPWCHAGVVRPLTNSWHIKAANNNLHVLPDAVMSTYVEGYDVELYSEKWLHYCRSSNWDWPTDSYVKEKTAWLLNFIDKRCANQIQLKYAGFDIGVNEWMGWYA